MWLIDTLCLLEKRWMSKRIREDDKYGKTSTQALINCSYFFRNLRDVARSTKVNTTLKERATMELTNLPESPLIRPDIPVTGSTAFAGLYLTSAKANKMATNVSSRPTPVSIPGTDE